MTGRRTTGQPEISPHAHPDPHGGVLTCRQCHDPHSPGLRAPKSSTKVATEKNNTPDVASSGENCFSCHGPLGRDGFAPVLAGQSYEILKDKLTKFRSGEVTGTMMNSIESEMKDKEIDSLASYFEEIS